MRSTPPAATQIRDCSPRPASKPHRTPARASPRPRASASATPDRLVEEIKKWEACGVDQINFLLNALETIPQEQVLDSLRLFGEQVMPHFTDDKPATTSEPRELAATVAAGD